MNRDRDALTASASKLSTPKDIIDLYTKIPDYAQVKHLGNSEFINTLERLKEEFRQIRSSLYEDSLSDLDNDTDEKLVLVNVKPESVNKKKDGRFGLTSARAAAAVFHRPDCSERKFGVDALGQNNQQYLSITSCPLHTTPAHYGYHQHHNDDAFRRNYLLANISSSARPVNFRNRYYDSKTDSAFQDDDELETGNERRRVGIGVGVGRYVSSPAAAASSRSSSSTPTMSTTISVWSSNPEIYHKSYTDYVPPANIEKRIQWRNAQSLSRSEPQLHKARESNKDVCSGIGQQKSQIIHFKAHPVPDHVHQPLFDQIMLRNKLRSEQVREESKQRLLAQVKPFSFTTTATSPATLRRNTNTATCGERKSFGHGFGNKMKKDFFSSNRNHELYLLSQKADLEEHGLNNNNTKPSKQQQKQNLRHCLRAHHHHRTEQPVFRAKPAPPRTRALMAAVRLREQQEYRELKKRLRAEALMKTSSLPPSMAARDKRQKATQAKINAILNILDNNAKHAAKSRRTITRSRRISTSSTDDAGASLNTDDEAAALSDDEHGLTSSWSSKLEAEETENKSQRSESRKLTKMKKPKNFTSFGLSKCAPKEDGVFESTAVDNHASRLRVQAARKREQDRIRREQEEQVRLQKMEGRRQRLRIWHMPAWKHASSYSSTQDISMRCELRLAASILEKEAFRRDMNNMLTRVQSAPLLLEGVRERKYELCKKHREELGRGNDNMTPRSTRIYSPRNLPEKVHWSTTSHVGFIDDQYGFDKSETAAIAEGTYSTNSDNESVKNIDLDSRSSAAAVAVDNNNEAEEGDFQRRWMQDEVYLREGKVHQWEKDNGTKSLPHYNETVELLNEPRVQKESVSPEIESPKFDSASPERDSPTNGIIVPEKTNGRERYLLSPDVDDKVAFNANESQGMTTESTTTTAGTQIESIADMPNAASPPASPSFVTSSRSQVAVSRFAEEDSTAPSYVDDQREEEPEVHDIDDATFFD